jgi:hypothetical protein
MDAITPKEALPKVETRLLPALAEEIAKWFPELAGRAMAVTESAVTKENIPTLPLVVVAFVRSVGEESIKSRQSQFGIQDHFIVEFWLEPEMYKRKNGTDAPFWSYYNYEAIRDKLLTHMATWQAPRSARIAFRALDIEADHLAVTLTFGFVAEINWKVCVTSPPDWIINHIGFNLCTPASECCPDAICEDQCKDPCIDVGIKPPEPV